MTCVDERPLSERLREKVPKGEWERRSVEIGENLNAISRWINRDPIPGPGKWDAIAALLGISVFEVGAAVAADQRARHRARLSQ